MQKMGKEKGRRRTQKDHKKEKRKKLKEPVKRRDKRKHSQRLRKIYCKQRKKEGGNKEIRQLR